MGISARPMGITARLAELPTSTPELQAPTTARLSPAPELRAPTTALPAPTPELRARSMEHLSPTPGLEASSPGHLSPTAALRTPSQQKTRRIRRLAPSAGSVRLPHARSAWESAPSGALATLTPPSPRPPPAPPRAGSARTAATTPGGRSSATRPCRRRPAGGSPRGRR